jgi:hypothetical protein
MITKRRIFTLLTAFMLAVLFAVPALAHSPTAVQAQNEDDATVTWTVTESAEYTVEDNGNQPVVIYNDCLATNSTYTIDFTVNIDTDESLAARFATVGEATQLVSVSFSPAAIEGPGPADLNATMTIQTGDQTAPNTGRFGAFVETEPGAAPLGDSFLTIDMNCIEEEAAAEPTPAPTPEPTPAPSPEPAPPPAMPPTGAADNATLALTAGALLLLAGTVMRRIRRSA